MWSYHQARYDLNLEEAIAIINALIWTAMCVGVWLFIKEQKEAYNNRRAERNQKILNERLRLRDELDASIKEEEERLKDIDIINWRWCCICGEPTDYLWPKNLNNILYDTHQYPKSIGVNRNQLQELKSFVPRDKELFNLVCGECGDSVVGIRCIPEK